LYALLARYATFLEGLFNAGETRQGAIAWVIAVLPAVLGAWLVYTAAYGAHPLLALVVNVAALYLTMGFRQRSHYFTAIHLALKDNNLAKARDILSAWREASCADLDREAIARLAIEEALVASHRYVFAVIFWFVLLRADWGDSVSTFDVPKRPVGRKDLAGAGALQPFCAPRVRRIRLAAGALHCGRLRRRGRLRGCGVLLAHAGRKLAGSALGIVLASGAGAIGVRLGMPILAGGAVVERPELGLGDPADTGHLDSTVGLVWRALVVWLLVLLLIALAGAST